MVITDKTAWLYWHVSADDGGFNKSCFGDMSQWWEAANTPPSGGCCSCMSFICINDALSAL